MPYNGTWQQIRNISKILRVYITFSRNSTYTCDTHANRRSTLRSACPTSGTMTKKGLIKSKKRTIVFTPFTCARQQQHCRHDDSKWPLRIQEFHESEQTATVQLVEPIFRIQDKHHKLILINLHRYLIDLPFSSGREDNKLPSNHFSFA